MELEIIVDKINATKECAERHSSAYKKGSVFNQDSKSNESYLKIIEIRKKLFGNYQNMN